MEAEGDDDREQRSIDNNGGLRRPMNGFFVFCEQYSPIVRKCFPDKEARLLTKYLCEWWSSLNEVEKSPYTSLARQYKEVFMKANLEFRWHKMPPGSADSLPPSNAKPSTPSMMNGASCPVSSLLSSNPADMPNNEPPVQPKAPKPFKKRYLAAQPVVQPDEPSPGDAVVVSPEAARACEALLEMARNESRGCRSSDGSERRGSPSDTPPLQTLREAVWSKVAGTLLKQEEDKLVVPPKDCPMNLTNQCTIRGQQIIEHIIENILNMPMDGPMDPSSEPITFSLNNNQEQAVAPENTDPSGEVADSIKASIYESLKNDLLKGKVTPALPVTNGVPITTTANRTNSVVSTSPPVTPTTQMTSVRSPQAAPGQPSVAHPVSLSLRPPTGKRVSSPARMALLPSPPLQVPVSASTTGQDMLRLLGAGQMPINVGNVGNITITKTPRPAGQATTLPPPTLSFAPVASSSSTPSISLSLTRTSTSQVFSLNNAATMPLVLSSQASAVVLSGHQVPGGVVLSTQPTHRPGGECVVLSHTPPGVGQAGVVLSAGTPGLLLSGSPQTGGQMVITQPGMGGPLLLAGLPGGKLVLSTSPQQSPVQQVAVPQSPVQHDPNPDPVNLSLTKAPSPRLDSGPCKRPLSEQDEDDIRRSSRVGRGRRYQEFIEDGRISVGSSRKIRRSHRSGEDLGESELDSMEPLPGAEGQAGGSQTVLQPEDPNCHSINHWKKKMRTASLGENTHVDRLVPKPQPPRLEPTATNHQVTASHSVHTASNSQKFDLDAKMSSLEPLNLDQYQARRDSELGDLKVKTPGSRPLPVTVARATRQSPMTLQSPMTPGPSKAFDARLHRKPRDKC